METREKSLADLLTGRTREDAPASATGHTVGLTERLRAIAAGNEKLRAGFAEIVIESAADEIDRLRGSNAALLAALEDVIELAQEWADGKSRSHPDHERVDAAREVIALARGER